MVDEKKAYLDEEWLQQQMDKIGKMSTNQSFGDIRWAKAPNIGKLKFRILPGVEFPAHFAATTWRHYNILQGENKSFVCLGMGECQICHVLDAVVAAGQKPLQKLMRRGKSHYNALILDDNTYNASLVHLLSLSDYTFDWVRKIMTDPDLGLCNLIDPKFGHDIVFTRKGENKAFDRQVIPAHRPIADSDKVIDEILAQRYDLEKIFNVSEEIIKATKEAADDLAARVTKNLNIDVGQKFSSLDIPREEQKTKAPVPAPTGSELNERINKNKQRWANCYGAFDEKNVKCTLCPYSSACERDTGLLAGGAK